MAELPSSITFVIPHDPEAPQQEEREVPAGWEGEQYVISAARGPGAPKPARLDLPPNAVLEISLDDGTHLLVAAAEARRYLGEPKRGDTGDAIEIGPALQFGGVSRAGFGSWLIKSIRVFRKGPTGMTAIALAGTFQDKVLESREGLYRCATDRFDLQKVDAIEHSDKPALLFIHGTASSTKGSFAALWESEPRRRSLFEPYGTRIYALEHRSLTESPVANALDIVKHMPQGSVLHLVTHSRGGLVGELLARVGRRNAEPFTKEDLEQFREHARKRIVSGRESSLDEPAITRELKRLTELSRELRHRRIKIERFVRVACPARGTTLASGRLDRWASAMLNLLGWGLDATPVAGVVSPIYDAGKSFLLKLVEERTDATVLPGLESMMPESSLVALLNRPNVEVESSLHVIAGDFRGDSMLKKLGDFLSERFYGSQNDFVVNTPSMTGGAQRIQGIWLAPFRGPDVHHLNYFKRSPSADCVVGALAGNNAGFEPAAASREPIARGFFSSRSRSNDPIALLLPGIMGSHLAIGRDRIWFDPLDMIAGGMARAHVKAKDVIAEDVFSRIYGNFCRYLDDTHEVRVVPYDWRLSIQQGAQVFGEKFDAAVADARARDKPVRIVAHSMGGLVARAALARNRRWNDLAAHEGGRLVQLGTPNNGSHSIVEVLLGRDAFVQIIERWFDWKHGMQDFLQIVSEFPGVLELLPRPEGGENFLDPKVWEALSEADHNAADRWVVPNKEPLTRALGAWKKLHAAGLKPEYCVYVAGKAERTPVGVSATANGIQIDYTPEGDGRVPWKTGIPVGVPTWYMDAEHGNLCAHEPAFEALLEIIECGRTAQLATVPPVTRGEITREVSAPETIVLYPTAAEVENAIFGITVSPPSGEASRNVAVAVVHGNLANSTAPVIIGHYRYDGVMGSAAYLDRLLGGRLDQSLQLGIYPSEIGESRSFIQTDPKAIPRGAIVVGLGQVGGLSPGELQRTLTKALLRHVTEDCPDSAESVEGIEVGTVLVGTGFGGVEIAESVAALLRAAHATNRALESTQANGGRYIARLTIFEETLDRAIMALKTVEDVARDRRLEGAIQTDRRLRIGKGGFRRALCEETTKWWRRIRIVREKNQLRFTVLTDLARNEEFADPQHLVLVDSLAAQGTGKTTDNMGLSRTLFELLVPNRLKDAAPNERGLVLALDKKAAVIPWELMRAVDRTEPPLAANVGLVRQLSTVTFRTEVARSRESTALVIGVPKSNFPPLAGAKAEAQLVEAKLRQAGYGITEVIEGESLQILASLFDQRYRIMHFAGHGVVDYPLSEGIEKVTGMVIGMDAFLGAGEIKKLRHVPEVVFINCCHLGNMQADAAVQGRGELAAGLATAFIEMGVRAVIAAGWTVDDAAAQTFAQTFYDEMLGGSNFGEAVRAARLAAYAGHPAHNTWGAYQAYGDPEFRFDDSHRSDAWIWHYRSDCEVVAEADRIAARAGIEREPEKKKKLLSDVEWLDRERPATFRTSAAVSAALGRAYAELGESERAIACYGSAVAQESAQVNLRDVEQLGNLKVRLGAKLAASQKSTEKTRGAALMTQGIATLKQLEALAPTTERLALLGSAWKRKLTSLLKSGGSAERINQALRKSVDYYGRATAQARASTGEDDYYPLLNMLDGAFLLEARGAEGPFAAIAKSITAQCAAARRNADRRMRDEPDFFHAVVEAGTALTSALYATLKKPVKDARGIDDAAAQREIVAHYSVQIRRFGTAREWDSVVSHVESLLEMLPERQPANSRVDVKAARAGLAVLLKQLRAAQSS